MKYYLGLDVGGTKTFCLIGDETGRIHGFGRAGCGSYEYDGIEPAARENRLAVEQALKSAGLEIDALSGIGMGIAGADLPEDYVMLEREIYTPLFGHVRRNFHNDSMGGLRGGIRKPYGVVIACGTGCVCAGLNRHGEHTRAGGLGPEFGDIVSGTSIGEDGLRAVMQARDHVIPATRLADLFVQKGGCSNVEDLFHKLYRHELEAEALQPMAKLVFDAAFDGDVVACDILERGGRYLGAMVNAVAGRLGMRNEQFDVVMAGSVFKGSSPVLTDAMRTVIHRECPQAKLTMPEFEPVVGALLLGMDLDGEIAPGVYDTLASELQRVEGLYGVRFKTE